jgi:hypothetical protein
VRRFSAAELPLDLVHRTEGRIGADSFTARRELFVILLLPIWLGLRVGQTADHVMEGRRRRVDVAILATKYGKVMSDEAGALSTRKQSIR